MTGSGLAAQLSQSLEIIVRGTRRSVGQFIPQYRTDGQFWIDHTKTWACVRKRQSAKTLRATPGGCAKTHDHVGDAAEAVEREGRGLWGKTGAVVGAFGVPSVACDREKSRQRRSGSDAVDGSSTGT